MSGEPIVWTDELAARLPGRVRPGASIGELSTYRVGGAASVLVQIDSVGDLETVRSLVPRNTPFLVVGAGSNLLVSDSGFPGVAIQLGAEFASVEIESTPPTTDGVPRVRVIAGGACMLPRLARQVVAAGLTGFEWAVGVPGTIGGAVRMNAGGHGSDMAAAVERVSVFNLRTGGPTMWSADECCFGYRRSNIGPDDIVLFAELRLVRDPDRAAESSAELSEIVSWRRTHQPGGQNAGSVFANPPGDSAGRLIDECGLKGFRIGSAEVSAKHANFIQADPGGRADDVEALIQHVQRIVADRFGVELKVENRLIGFGPAQERST